jgi:hypothetical protein
MFGYPSWYDTMPLPGTIEVESTSARRQPNPNLISCRPLKTLPSAAVFHCGRTVS